MGALEWTNSCLSIRVRVREPYTEYPVHHAQGYVYIGQTGHTLEHRLKEHRRALTSGIHISSAIAENTLNTNYVTDWAIALVVNCHPCLYLRCMLEVWHIRSQRHPMNREQGFVPPTYNPLVYSSSISFTSHSN